MDDPLKTNNVGGIKIEEGEKRVFSTGAEKQPASGKGTPVLFPPDAYLEISKHFEDGAAVYAPRNWEKGIPLSKLIDSLERHIAQEKMGLTDEHHDRALAWNAVVYLATKLRIQAGILPTGLDDLCGAYTVVEKKILSDDNITIEHDCPRAYYIYSRTENKYLWADLKFHSTCCSEFLDGPPNVLQEGYYSTQEIAEGYLQEYLQKSASISPDDCEYKFEEFCSTCRANLKAAPSYEIVPLCKSCAKIK